MHNEFLTDAQLQAELTKCEYCEEKPCRSACPSHCSPADFIMAARVGEPADIKRAAAEIMMANPFGGVCGLVCPDTHCVAACVHKGFDNPVRIPSVQATIVKKAKELDGLPALPPVDSNGKLVAVVGAGPAGLAAASYLARLGYAVEIFEAAPAPGGACNLIPQHRLPREVLLTDIAWQLGLGDIQIHSSSPVESPEVLLERGFEGVIVAAGLTAPFSMGIPGEELALVGLDYLSDPADAALVGPVVVIGGGATAVDCAVTAKLRGAPYVEMIALERGDEMPLTPSERAELLEHGIELSCRSRVTAILGSEAGVEGIATEKVSLPAGAPFSLRDLAAVPGTAAERRDVRHVIIAIGARQGLEVAALPTIVRAGDFLNGPTTVVTASASGKNAAQQLHAVITGAEVPVFEDGRKSFVPVPGYDAVPVSLETDFFGRSIRSPFLLSAAPPSDGYEQMKLAYEAGWAGGIMKTAFSAADIHIPGGYMYCLDDKTYGNCDNVSGHSLERVCEEIERLVAEYPDRLTIGSTGGPVTGNDELDKAGWLFNTKMLEDAGAMGIEYSLSCPQGGDGTEGDIVSQNAALTAKIIDWIMEGGRGDVPKLFKLTGAVTSIAAIVIAIKEVLDRYPDKKAGITLANTFPSLTFEKRGREAWEEGVVVGLSGRGVTAISNLNLAMAAPFGVPISGNGGPMDYKAAADFLALGVKTVQFCTIVLKYGYGVIDELESGVSHLMAERGIANMGELIGRAHEGGAITDFMDLSPVKAISQVDAELCQHCGNCARCPYLAIGLNEDKVPVTDPSKCIGCSLCTLKCFAGALHMRDRSAEEQALLKED
jgi:NADPH-dependent glutamate synthase beta subunit-like oxidoreductase/dihydroorotate dehydrogenase/Pyruvate/2-oxoacid:ferredoxin oxidoreductase delta subunit